MKKGFAGLVLSAVMIFSMTGTGCGKNGTDSTENALTAEISESKEEHKIDISEIDWNVSASVVNGERITAIIDSTGALFSARCESFPSCYNKYSR